ncbi:hypothetical protein [Pseudonocardia sp.]|uniref:hypothetical protein n=1 Tax=Pseudonocardia sp. TaxID=60912 RepID=UPI002D8550DF|nr:hypothetical protein [Pseudonocardia sp.]
MPTLLSTMHDDLPDLRLLLVSGEACPQDLAIHWHRPFDVRRWVPDLATGV